MGEETEVLRHKLQQTRAANQNEQSQLTELSTTVARNRKAAQDLKEKVKILLASKKEMEDKAKALQVQKEALQKATKDAKTHLTKQQLAQKEAAATVKLENLKKIAGKNPKEAVDWSWR